MYVFVGLSSFKKSCVYHRYATYVSHMPRKHTHPLYVNPGQIDPVFLQYILYEKSNFTGFFLSFYCVVTIYSMYYAIIHV